MQVPQGWSGSIPEQVGRVQKLITNIIDWHNNLLSMHNPFIKIAANYSRFALQEERKYKILRPLIPKVHFMNLRGNQLTIEDQLHKELFTTPAQEFPHIPILLAAVTNSNIVNPLSEDSTAPLQSIQSTQYAGNVEIQDRISVGSLESISAQVMSVFDGHGGDMLSDYCANNIVQTIDKFIAENKAHKQYLNNEQLLISTALKEAYKKLDEGFFENVYKEQENLKNKKIKSIGSCGLTVILYNSNIYVANCGDSMAIVVTEEKGRFDFVNLHQRLSVNNPKERERLKNEFPDDPDIVVEAGKGCYYLKGRLQPTRTLGDYYMKHKEIWKNKNKKQFNGPYVKSEPDIHIEKVQNSFKYLILASDGVWDFLNEWEVIQACQNGNEAQSILEETLNKIGDLNGKTVKQVKDLDDLYRRDFHDDISIIVAPLNYYH